MKGRGRRYWVEKGLMEAVEMEETVNFGNGKETSLSKSEN